MIDTIEKILCETLGLNPAKFRRNCLGEYTASKEGFQLRKYTGAFWTAMEITRKGKEYLEMEITYDGNETAVSSQDNFLLEAKMTAAKTNEFKTAVEQCPVTGQLYNRLNEACRTRLKSTDDPAYSMLTVEIKQGEEEQAVKLVCFILAYRTKPCQTPAQPQKKLSRAER